MTGGKGRDLDGEVLLHEGLSIIMLLGEVTSADTASRAVLQNDALRSEYSLPLNRILLSREGEWEI